MYNEVAATRLKKTRRYLGYTQNEVSKEIGVNRTALNKMENNNQKIDAETLGALADFYEVSVDWLLGTKGEHKINETRKKEIEYYRKAK